ncbi:hypothetical protein [Flavobacterium sp. 25HG05S-40]|uniref:hypothetical protein n=1 Tax=Flavobacterium sp. 25HG05S-40 TaxID=3458682 RepID=UPI004044107B
MSDSYLFYNPKENPKAQIILALFFPVFTIIALGLDSVYFKDAYFDGRMLTNFLAVIYFSILFYFSESELRKLMFVMVFLSYIGELIFCSLLGMYQYKGIQIPFYVPFGHAIVYASGFIFAHTLWSIQNTVFLKKGFIVFFVSLFCAVGFLLKDWFTLIFGPIFIMLLLRKKGHNLYSFIALCVIFIELVGTYFQCWTWSPKIFDSIPTINPPMGAVFFYAGGDVLLAKIVSRWNSQITKKQAKT